MNFQRKNRNGNNNHEYKCTSIEFVESFNQILILSHSRNVFLDHKIAETIIKSNYTSIVKFQGKWNLLKLVMFYFESI